MTGKHTLTESGVQKVKNMLPLGNQLSTFLIHTLDTIAFEQDCKAGNRGLLTSFVWC